jgi:MOSC domain-containing protein YiiM
VAREGELGSGDDIQILSRDEHHVSVADIIRLYAFDRKDFAGMRRAAQVKALPDSWKSYFFERVQQSTV